LALSSKKYGFGIQDPDKPIPDPGSRGQKGTGSRIRIRNTGKKYSITIKKILQIRIWIIIGDQRK
jgi:hypothetical protein